MNAATRYPAAGLTALCLACAALSTNASWGPILPELPVHNLYGKVETGTGNNTELKDSWDDGSLSNRDTDQVDPVYRITAGYQINPFVGVEASYRDLGKYSMSGTSDGTGNSWSAGSISGTQEADGWALSITGRWPISARWTLYGTFGWLWWESEEHYNENGFTSSLRESGSDVTFSGGVEFDHGHSDRFVYTAGLSHDRVGDDDLDIVSGFAGILYRFP